MHENRLRPEEPSVTMRVTLTAARLLMAGIFIYAGIDKIAHPAAFAQDVYNYQILPDALINLSALVLPWLELFLGLCLLAGLWLPGAVLAVNGLLIVFLGALVFNLARGLDINCGCFSTGSTAPAMSTGWYLLGMRGFSPWEPFCFARCFLTEARGDRKGYRPWKHEDGKGAATR